MITHPFELRNGRRGKAPAEATPMALLYLRSYLGNKSNKKRATVALLRCSERTAARLIASGKPYRSRMKMEWVIRICEVMGKPLTDVIRKQPPKTLSQALIGWNTAETFSQALHLACDCAMSVVLIASNEFGLRGRFTIRHEANWPSEIEFVLSPAPELAALNRGYDPHRLLICCRYDHDGKRRMYLQHGHAGHGRIHDDFLTLPSLLEHLKEIHGLTKNYTTDVRRESTRLSAAKSG